MWDCMFSRRCEDDSLLGYGALCSRWSAPTFLRCALPPSSGRLHWWWSSKHIWNVGLLLQDYTASYRISYTEWKWEAQLEWSQVYRQEPRRLEKIFRQLIFLMELWTLLLLLLLLYRRSLSSWIMRNIKIVKVKQSHNTSMEAQVGEKI
jgi:hypothetical protein